jgi:hypothetical protein
MLAAGAASPWPAILPGGTTPRTPRCSLAFGFVHLLLAFGFAVPPGFRPPSASRSGFRPPLALRCPAFRSSAAVAVSACPSRACFGVRRPFVAARSSLPFGVWFRWPSLVFRAPAALRSPPVVGSWTVLVFDGPRFCLTTVRPPHACGVAPRAGRRFPFGAPFPVLSWPWPRLRSGPARLRLCGVGRLCRAPFTGGWAGWGFFGVLGLGGCGRRSVLGLWRCSGPVRRGSRPSGGGPLDGTVRHLPPPPGRGR